MEKHITQILLIVLALMLPGCGSRTSSKGSQEAVQERSFPPRPTVPSMMADPKDAAEYLVLNWWKAFLDTSKTYFCDSTHVNGVKSEDVESELGMYVTILENGCTREFAAKAVDSFFSDLERYQEAVPSSNVFPWFETKVTKYLYDPNSPVRDEDLYQPFVERLSKSKLTDDGMKLAYSHDAQMCSLNKVGTPAADFSFTDLQGKVHRLSDIRAGVTVLFFSNPGCPACREIVDQFNSDQRIVAMVASGTLAVVNIYIDLELDKWREYASTYPKEWYTGYDHTYTIRTDMTYSVRAIPSLYLLDAQKNVLMKDAPSDRVVAWLDNYSESIKEK